MVLSKNRKSKPSSLLESNPNGLQILSHNSFTDSVGYLHVVGEVQNNTPANAQFVQVIGTFYDNNNQVVGTQFTYTNPSDIGAGQKAPFELILTSASIPVSQVDRYNLITSSQ
ncbi:MAG: FxLYD domain-containing protein [Nitrososphaeraceae archaeon]|nr:FxLYD domain-containing protein [Nitrososphaeraceae archaeon]MDW0167935.1 FxLYD domain-containing protein [Nitrososphaeraceae archaeon]MDW0170851.1 FxLYD domain-containing protein [Nitrososphaeraceae archaeon]MDW0172446.1 FxLYD domain-containing protein [Nitrososphaeraceae archaeon]MDW0174682.1 FxLYD domain-containing protein [Nitrososphaeraceae archaeon]